MCIDKITGFVAKYKKSMCASVLPYAVQSVTKMSVVFFIPMLHLCYNVKIFIRSMRADIR